MSGSVEQALAALREERRRRLGGALDAVALARASTASRAAALAAAAGASSAEPAGRAGAAEPGSARGGWGPRPQPGRDGILRSADEPDASPAEPAGPTARPSPDPDPDDPGASWLR